MSILRDWLLGRVAARPHLSHLHFVVYTRQGCHLCEDAWDRLEEWQRRYGFTLETVDIDTDPELLSQYNEQVPVVAINGKVRFRGCVSAVLLKRLLEAEAKQSVSEPRP